MTDRPAYRLSLRAATTLAAKHVDQNSRSVAAMVDRLEAAGITYTEYLRKASTR